jgi:hypothetical protein
MFKMKKLALAVAVSSPLVLAGCGGSSSSSSDGGTTVESTVSGTAVAPGGAVAHFEPQSLFEVALSFVVTPVAAAITGLDPIEGATVELIRVDDQGNQVGDVLATTATSITGDYTLTLPEGVNLAGNLIVRITGANDELRAQVVEQEVDINPVSEFVLRKFIETGADLDQLVVEDVVKLNGTVEEFDLVADGLVNLDQVYEALESEVGDFVESEVAVVSAGDGDATTVAGDYRSVAFSFELHDNEDSTYGDYAHDMWTAYFTMADGGDSTVSITLNDENGAYGRIGGNTLATSNLYLDTYTEQVDETFPGTLTDSGILSIAGEFEENIDGDYGWRRPATTYNLLQVADRGLFVVQPNEAAVRYLTVDTDNDGVKDAIDPDQKSGDEAFRSMEMFARLPTAFQDSDLSGKFGRVYVGSYLMGGVVELETEVNTLNFYGDGTFDYSDVTEGHGHRISLESGGVATYTSITDIGSTSEPVTITADGDITHIGSDDQGAPVPADGFINDTSDFIVLSGAENLNDGTASDYSANNQTVMLKLPSGTSAPSVSGNKYRMQAMSMKLGADEAFSLFSGKFNTFLTMTSESAGEISGSFLEVEKNGLAGQISVGTSQEEGTALTASIASDGATTLTIDDTDGATIMDGFFNEDASMGIFALRWEDIGGTVDELGLVVLIETE